VVGAIALTSSALSVRRGAAKQERVMAGLGASALTLAIYMPILFAAFCGWD
jgi:hypothetical protein